MMKNGRNGRKLTEEEKTEIVEIIADSIFRGLYIAAVLWDVLSGGLAMAALGGVIEYNRPNDGFSYVMFAFVGLIMIGVNYDSFKKWLKADPDESFHRWKAEH